MMVKADGKIKRSEMQLIQKLAKRLGIHKDEVSQIFKHPQPTQTLYSEVDRITHFYRLALVMQVDQEIHDSEIGALKNFGLKMGIRPVVADQIINIMNQYKGSPVPAEELLNIFKIYYN